jgi:DNA-binding NarL/FixJ family response regulator
MTLSTSSFVDEQLIKAQALWRKGETGKAEALLRSALQVATQLRDSQGMAALHLELARSLIEVGMALQHLDQALSLCRHLRQDDLLLQAISMRVERLLELGDIPLASAGLEEVRALAAGADDPRWRIRCACLEASLASASKAHLHAANFWETAAASARAVSDSTLFMHCQSQALLSQLRATGTVSPEWVTTLPTFLADWLALGTPAGSALLGGDPTNGRPDNLSGLDNEPLKWCCDIAQALVDLDAPDKALPLLAQAVSAVESEPPTSPTSNSPLFRIRLAQASAALKLNQREFAAALLSQAATLLPLLASHHQEASRASWLLLSAQCSELHGDHEAAYRHRVALRALESKLQRAQLDSWVRHRQSRQYEVSRQSTAPQSGSVHNSQLSATGIAVPQALTPQQHAVFQHLCQGKTNKAIALELGLSPLTVRQHVSDILSRLGVKTRAAAVARAAVLQPPAPPSQA